MSVQPRDEELILSIARMFSMAARVIMCAAGALFSTILAFAVTDYVRRRRRLIKTAEQVGKAYDEEFGGR